MNAGYFDRAENEIETRDLILRAIDKGWLHEGMKRKEIEEIFHPYATGRASTNAMFIHLQKPREIGPGIFPNGDGAVQNLGGNWYMVIQFEKDQVRGFEIRINRPFATEGGPQLLNDISLPQ